MKIIIRFLFSTLIFFFPLTATSGSVDGPFVVMVDLSQSKELRTIFESLQRSEAMQCMGPETKLFFDRRPSEMSDELVIDGMIRKNKSVMRKLDKLLHLADDDIDKGYDGIVVYVDHPKRKFITLVTGSLPTIDTKIPKLKSNASFIKLLCEALPPITRRP